MVHPRLAEMKFAHDLPDDLFDSLIDVDDERVVRFFEVGELAVQQTRFREVMRAVGEACGDERLRSSQVYELCVGFGELLAIFLFQCGTGDHEISVLGVGAVHGGADGGEPRSAIFVGERNAGGHLGFIGGGVKVVGIGERPVQMRGESTSDRGFTGAFDAHQEEDHLEMVTRYSC